ncbi:MAG: tRNA lysidine(34) synthetase TilS [Pseudomonadales bacterium]|nr:tRNA lysidine(34) synthetase TilS [Pseudomonadales bacterium]
MASSLIESAYKQTTECCAAQLRELLTEHSKLNHIHVAYSGGMDSHILLLITQQALELIQLDPFFLNRKLDLTAIHVNHQLDKNSTQWQQHCEQVCAQLQIPMVCESVEVAAEQGFSLEEQARIQRYRVFEKYIESSSLLLMAHHLDDQMETLLMRLLKGAGPTGLAGIPRQRSIGKGRLLRPLLDTSRQQLLEFASLKGLKWIEDPSNASVKHDRNYLRHTVLPLLEQRWPGYRKTWSRTIGVCSDYAQLAGQVAEQDYIHTAGSELSQLKIKPLFELDRFRQKNLIRHWLGMNGLNNSEHGWVETILDEVAAASKAAMPIFKTSSWQVRRFNQLLYLLETQKIEPHPDFDPCRRYEWDLQAPIFCQGSGIVAAESLISERNQGLRLPENERVTIRFRQGGERCRPVGRHGSRPLKKLFNEYKIEPWLRDIVPLIYFDDQLVAVPNYFICEPYQATERDQALQLEWKRVEAPS